MGQQLESGTQFPMRPVQAIFNLASGDALASDAAPVDWTTAGHRLTPVIETELMDDHSKLSVSTTDITLQRGQWAVDINVRGVNAGAGAEDMEVALTDAAGTTVHWESGAITIGAAQDGYCHATVLLNLTVDSVVNLRAAQSTAGTDITVAPEQVLYIRKVGNVNES